jgi:integrase
LKAKKPLLWLPIEKLRSDTPKPNKEHQMASLLTHNHGQKAGAKFIRFFRGDERPMIYLGKVSDRFADTVLRHVEDLVSARAGGMSPAPATAKWLTTIDAALSQKLADAGLIDAPADSSPAATKLDAFIADYLATRSDLKPSTRTNLAVARRSLVTFFGAGKLLSAITAGDADEFRLWLRRKKPAKPGEPMPPGFADNTARRVCGRAKQFFEAARKKRLILESPFEDIGDCQVKSNKSRDRFITRDEAQKVFDACPNAQWRLLFALSRYAGMRCPSEHAGLRWSDIDWANNRFTVRSPKTEHHEGHDSRVVPIFAELRPYLEAARAESPKDAEHVLTIRTMRAAKPNPRTTMEKIIKKAGLTPWPKLFHNLRASRQTELESQGHPTHVVCSWLGNSPKVAREHYLRATEADFEKAAMNSGSYLDRLGVPSEEPSCAQTGRLKGSRPSTAESGLLSEIVQKALESGDFGPFDANVGQAVQNYLAPPVGSLDPTKSKEKCGVAKRRAADSAASHALTDKIAAICRGLPANIVAGLLLLAEGAG